MQARMSLEGVTTVLYVTDATCRAPKGRSCHTSGPTLHPLGGVRWQRHEQRDRGWLRSVVQLFCGIRRWTEDRSSLWPFSLADALCVAGALSLVCGPSVFCSETHADEQVQRTSMTSHSMPRQNHGNVVIGTHACFTQKSVDCPCRDAPLLRIGRLS